MGDAEKEAAAIIARQWGREIEAFRIYGKPLSRLCDALRRTGRAKGVGMLALEFQGIYEGIGMAVGVEDAMRTLSVIQNDAIIPEVEKIEAGETPDDEIDWGIAVHKADVADLMRTVRWLKGVREFLAERQKVAPAPEAVDEWDGEGGGQRRTLTLPEAAPEAPGEREQIAEALGELLKGANADARRALEIIDGENVAEAETDEEAIGEAPLEEAKCD